MRSAKFIIGFFFLFITFSFHAQNSYGEMELTKSTRKELRGKINGDKKDKAIKSVHENESGVKLTENFNKFIQGTEEVPDKINLPDENGDIPEEFTHTAGWMGICVYQAGGLAYVGLSEDEYDEFVGSLITHEIDLSYNSGEYWVIFNARSTEEKGDVFNIWYILNDEYTYKEIKITNKWEEYNVVMTGGYDGMRLEFDADKYPFFMDYIYILQVPVPEMAEPTNITREGFTANWDEVLVADEYEFYTYLTHKAKEKEIYFFSQENFNDITDEIDLSNDTLLNDYTVYPDWCVFNPVAGTGRIGIENTEDSIGRLISPAYEIRNNNGKFTVEIKAVSAIGDSLFVTHIQRGDTVMKEEFKEEGETFIFEVDNYSTGNSIAITSNTKIVTFIDEIQIYTELDENEFVSFAYYYEKTSDTSIDVLTPNSTEEDVFSYTARTVVRHENRTFYSDFAERMIVEFPVVTSITNTKENINIFSVDGKIYMHLDKEYPISIYDSLGKLIFFSRGKIGENIVEVPQKGFYIIKVGDSQIKIIQ